VARSVDERQEHFEYQRFQSHKDQPSAVSRQPIADR
jgi:hypothetical protein